MSDTRCPQSEEGVVRRSLKKRAELTRQQQIPSAHFIDVFLNMALMTSCSPEGQGHQ